MEIAENSETEGHLTGQDWAELAHLANVASQDRPELRELRDKVRRIAQSRNGIEAANA